MEKPKFCVDCRWCLQRDSEHGTSYGCCHPVSIKSKGVPEFDMVTGRQEIDIFERVRMCDTMRNWDMCGPEAKLWEAKP